MLPLPVRMALAGDRLPDQGSAILQKSCFKRRVCIREERRDTCRAIAFTRRCKRSLYAVTRIDRTTLEGPEFNGADGGIDGRGIAE